jgi:hypothetical protein
LTVTIHRSRELAVVAGITPSPDGEGWGEENLNKEKCFILTLLTLPSPSGEGF